ncbi:MAG: alpha-glucuronidase family glycosyl hydrolase [Brevundimonas sp.]|uniref:alpha-glucuronidase family glycosyl hydrolase n=1 Tax=Brevundimonas sp. TaxID=1871086 RepID=UPI002735B641|nr:alpha-glucuronidase family glycosyl hydrolase [Brevundimonas sp.]MDP3403597.1 alpha-glucuronidase family glycosyl hydrolase [Brevundimonas sp.]
MQLSACFSGRGRSWLAVLLVLAVALPGLAGSPARAGDGYELWLRYPPLDEGARRLAMPLASRIVIEGQDDSLRVAGEELVRGIDGLLQATPAVAPEVTAGAIVLGLASSPRIQALALPLAELGPEGYLIRSVQMEGRPVTVIAANTGPAVLYGAFEWLRRLQVGDPLTDLDVRSTPALRLRVLNHWDNLNRTVERGYAGQSIWDWHTLPGFTQARYVDYARANASIGINGTVLNNVNSNALSLTAPWIEKAAALADVFRPWGVRVYLSARFSAPVEIGGLASADPLDPAVAAWWRAKADELYAAIPDFGGFLVKANSEGQPGPQDYGRSHAEGANMLADAVAPHGGVVMWRAFVYSAENATDRARQAYEEFVPLDGTFRDNVLVQVKNGPIDFQPREPFHPMFGAMPGTPLMMEFQITKEYLGFATHIAYLGTMYEETLQSVTDRPVAGATVADVIDGSAEGHTLSGMAGVANIGSDRNWSGSHFDQANWYVFGRMAWDPRARAEPIARDWAQRTFTTDPAFVEPVVGMMMGSREAVVDYMTPLGLHHVMATGHHYGPGPWVDDLDRPEWNPVYYHRADATGIGFDRTATGSNALAQYAPGVGARYADPATVDERDLLWFHHVAWDRPMRSGRTLWDELVVTYGRGVSKVGEMRRTWSAMEPHVDARRFDEVSQFLAIQEQEAKWWRDASVSYFRTLADRPLPAGEPEPEFDLEHYRALSFPLAPGNTH